MEGDEIFASLESIWFYSNVFLQPSPKHNNNCYKSQEEQEPRRQDFAEGQKRSQETIQDPKCIKKKEVLVSKKRAAERSREFDARMDIWQKRGMKTSFAVPARCSLMPPPGDGLAMKAHLRSWAHAVACSVR